MNIVPCYFTMTNEINFKHDRNTCRLRTIMVKTILWALMYKNVVSRKSFYFEVTEWIWDLRFDWVELTRLKTKYLPCYRNVFYS